MILGIIPARGGSKGIPRKNIKQIGGKPLIAWTIEHARTSKLMDDFIVSTEDDEIEQVSKKFGARVLKRTPELAQDKTSAFDVMIDIVNKLNPDIIVYLQPTSPIRSEGLIDRCIKKFINEKADSLATGTWIAPDPILPNDMFSINSEDARRQDMKGFYQYNGNIYILNKELVLQRRLRGDRPLAEPISKAESIDIDDAFDFWLAEKILEEKVLLKEFESLQR